MTTVEPPFFRGDVATGPWCDYIAPGNADCCDARPSYAIWWTPVPEYDDETIPVSAACAEHALLVDRRLVDRMTNEPSRGNR